MKKDDGRKIGYGREKGNRGDGGRKGRRRALTGNNFRVVSGSFLISVDRSTRSDLYSGRR